MFIYVVQTWSKEKVRGEHLVDTIHIASSNLAAREFCKTHTDYNSSEYPWIFKIIKCKLDEDQCCTVHNTYEVMEVIDPDRSCHDNNDDKKCDYDCEAKCPHDCWCDCSNCDEPVINDSDGCGEHCESGCSDSEACCTGECSDDWWDSGCSGELANKSTYDKWMAYWQSLVDWPADPEGWEVWDACIDTVIMYLENMGTYDAEKLKALKTTYNTSEE